MCSATYAYGTSGKLVEATNNVSLVTFDLDELDRVQTTTVTGQGDLSDFPTVSVSYEYDANGNRINYQDPYGSNSYTFDASDRLTTLTNHLGRSFFFDIGIGGRLEKIRRPGSESEVSFNNFNELVSIRHSSSSNGQIINRADYTYDIVGKMLSDTTSHGNRSFGYDTNNQLISATQSALLPAQHLSYQSETFQYDEIGNRISDQSGSYIYDVKSQRLVEDYKYFYHFDENGNLVQKQEKSGFPNSATTIYRYSSENQLIEAKVFSSNLSNPDLEIAYAYDAIGRRIQKKVIDHLHPQDISKTYVRRYVYDGEEVTLEYNEDNELLAKYTHSGLRTDDVLSVEITDSGRGAQLATASANYYFLKDIQGTITDVVSETGQKIQHYVYSSFGALLGIQDANGAFIESPIVATSYSFTGREFERELGLYYYRARYYNPWIGRFLQKDPQPGQTNVPISAINKYVYAANSPLNVMDSSGESFLDFLSGLFSILAGIFVAVVTAGAAFAAGGLIAEASIGLLGPGLVGNLVGSIGGALVGSTIGAFGGGYAGGLIGGGTNLIKGGSWDSGFSKGYELGRKIGSVVGSYLGSVGANVGGFRGKVSANISYGVPDGIPIISGLVDIATHNCLLMTAIGATAAISGGVDHPVTQGSAFFIGQSDPPGCGSEFVDILSFKANFTLPEPK